MSNILSYPTTGETAREFRRLSEFGMNVADFADASAIGYERLGSGGTYTVSQWISAGAFADLAAAQAAYPIIQNGNDQVDWVLLQTAVNFMIYGALGNSNYRLTKRTLFIPAGMFTLNRPLLIGYAKVGTPPANLNGNGYVSITLQGEGPHMDPSGNGMTGTTLHFPYTNDIGIGVTFGQQILIRGMTVRGGYTYNNSLSVLNTAGAWDIANWKDPALPAVNWIDGDAVNVGICLEPYSSAVNAAAYPPRVLPAYFGGGTTMAQFTTAGGSWVTLEDVNLSEWVIGYGRPHGDANGEFIHHHRGVYSMCVYGIANGHSQARNLSFRDLNFFGFHTAITNEGGSQGNLNAHGTYENLHFGYGFQCFYYTMGGWSGPVKITNAYAEGVVRIGTITTMLELDTFYFSGYDQGGTGNNPRFHLEGVSNLSMRNCTFITRNGFFIKASRYAPGRMTATNCYMECRSSNLTGEARNAVHYMNGYFGMFGQSSRSVEYLECSTYNNDARAQFKTSAGHNEASGETLTHCGQDTTTYMVNMHEVPYSWQGSDALLGFYKSFEVPKIGYDQVYMYAAGARTGYDIIFPRTQMGPLKADVGDIFNLGESGQTYTVFVVQSISGANMVLRQQNDYFSTTNSNYFTSGLRQMTEGQAEYGMYTCTRIRRNPALIIGSVTAGSNVITNVKRALYTGNTVTTRELTMAVGDLFIHQELDILNAGGSAVPPLNPVTAIDTVAQTITLTNNFTVTNPNYPVVFYVKVFNP